MPTLAEIKAAIEAAHASAVANADTVAISRLNHILWLLADRALIAHFPGATDTPIVVASAAG